MKLSQKHALIASFKKWLFPPSPSQQIFLALRGTNVLGQPKDLSVSLRLGRAELQDAQLPFTEDFLGKFKEWSSGYLKYAERSRSIAKRTDINPADSAAPIPNTSVTRKPQATIGEQTSGSILDANTFDGVTARFERSLYDLLNNDNKFSAIRDELMRILPAKGKAQPEIYIQYEDPHLAELPLHLWSVFQERGIEPVFSSLAAQAQKYSFKRSQKPRILLLLGDSSNLDLQRDIIIWKEQFPNAEIKDVLVKHQSDVSKILWNERWDILYFAGHSETEDGSGKIYLSDDVSITFNDLQQGLKQSVSKGLGLAIFNSCISLGAAADLQKAGVPTIVAMRHIIHDTVAPKFLEYFLQAYLSLGKSIKNAVQIARYRLKESEEINFRCASWLPVVFQIPTIPVRPKPSPLIAIATSFFVTCLVFFLHTQGIFQRAELSLYDHMMNSRPVQRLDPRIVIVQTTGKDRKLQEQEGRKVQGQETINDQDLLELLNKLDKAKPKVIGMAYSREYSTSNSPKIKELVDKRIISPQTPILVSNCSSPSDETRIPTLPPNIMPERHPHIGFTNISSDINVDDTTRRLLLLHNTGSECNEKYTQFSLPLQIVLDYFNIDKEQDIKRDNSNGLSIEINNPITKKLIKISGIQKGQGGYQVDQIENLTGFSGELSILFNYKNHGWLHPDTDKIPVLSLKDVISGTYDDLLRDKIVLIGGIGDDKILIHSSKDKIKRVDNLFIHAQAVDYLLRVFDGDKLLIGIDSDLWLFLIFEIFILLNSVIINQLSMGSRYIQPFTLAVSTIAIFYIVYTLHSWILHNMLLWIPSIPILLGVLISGVFISSQFFRKLSYNLTQ